MQAARLRELNQRVSRSIAKSSMGKRVAAGPRLTIADNTPLPSGRRVLFVSGQAGFFCSDGPRRLISAHLHGIDANIWSGKHLGHSLDDLSATVPSRRSGGVRSPIRPLPESTAPADP